jgi:hypothetical protein
MYTCLLRATGRNGREDRRVRYEGERETAIFRIRNPRQNAQGDGPTFYGHFAGIQADGEQLSGDEFWLAEVVNVQWSQIRDPRLGGRGRTHFRPLIKS